MRKGARHRLAGCEGAIGKRPVPAEQWPTGTRILQPPREQLAGGCPTLGCRLTGRWAGAMGGRVGDAPRPGPAASAHPLSARGLPAADLAKTKWVGSVRARHEPQPAPFAVHRGCRMVGCSGPGGMGPRWSWCHAPCHRGTPAGPCGHVRAQVRAERVLGCGACGPVAGSSPEPQACGAEGSGRENSPAQPAAEKQDSPGRNPAASAAGHKRLRNGA